MNFELKALDVAGAASIKCDLLILLVPESFVTAPAQKTDALSELVATVLQHGDMTKAVGKQLHLYQPAGVIARRVLLLGAGSGAARDVRSALAAATATLKSEGINHAVVCLSALPDATGSQTAAMLTH